MQSFHSFSCSLLRSGEDAKRNRIMIGVVLALTILIIFRLCSGRSQDEQHMAEVLDFFSACGHVTGEALASAFPQGGRVLVVYPARPVEDGVRTLIEKQLEGLSAGLGDVPIDLTVQEVEERDPGVGIDRRTGHFVQEQTMRAYLRSVPDADAVVLLYATYRPHARERPGQLPPLFLALPHPREVAETLVQRGPAGFVVVVREDARWEAKAHRGMTPREVFDLRYTSLFGAQ